MPVTNPYSTLHLRRQVASHRAANHSEFWRLRRLFEDLIGTFDAWPRTIYKIFFFTLRPTNKERFSLTVFLLCNGVSPELILEYYGLAYIWDRNTWDQVRWVIKNYPDKHWTAFNVAMGRSM